MSSFVVTTSIAGVSRTRIWHDSTPMTVGSPLRWVIEKTPNGVRARDLQGRAHEIRKDAIREIDLAALNQGQGAVLDLPLSGASARASSCKLQIRPVRKIESAFGTKSGDQLNIFSGFGASIHQAQAFNNEYSAKTGKQTVFTLKRGAHGYDLTILSEGVRAGGSQRKNGETLHLSSDELLKLRLALGARSWHFGFLPEPKALAEITAATPQTAPSFAEDAWFAKSLRYSGLGLLALLGIIWLWPAPKPTEELIPAQYTKLVFQNPTSEPAAPAAGEATTVAPKNAVEKAAVVQAFRAKALRNSVDGLLKGGMTRLLVQSDFVSSRASADQTKAIFSKTNALGATGAETGVMDSQNVQIASIGGGSGGSGKVGYGKGGGAAVAGQGTSHISLDLGGSSVEEGLTKEEVGEVIHRHLSEVRYCYESAMLRTPGIEGRLIINFVIGATGAVRTSEVRTSTLPDPRLDDCILRRLNTWRFPKTKGGIDVAVSYPFIFKTLGR